MSVHWSMARLTAYLRAYLRIFLSRVRSRPRSCAATVITRMPYDTGEIGSFGTNRPYEPLSLAAFARPYQTARGPLRALGIRRYASLASISRR